MFGQDHYIYRLRAACIQQPHLNRHQLAALDRELTLVKAASTPEEHLAASNNMIGLARAEAMDRAANALDIARRHDDPWSAAAAGIEYIHAQQGDTHAELYENIAIGHQRAIDFRAISASVHSAIRGLFSSLLHVHTSNFELGPAQAEIERSFRTLRNADPAFVPRTWLDHPRYNRRVPWRCDRIHAWLKPYWIDEAFNPPPIPPDPGFLIDVGPSPSHDWPAAEPLDAPFATHIADAYLARQREWPDEFLARFWQTAKDELNTAASSIARYAVAQDQEARFAIEATHHFLEFSTHLAPLRAKINDLWENTPETREGLDKALVTSQELTGLTYDEILQTPRVLGLIENNLNPRLRAGSDGFGALDGEAGFDLLRHCFPCAAVRGVVDFYA